MYYFHVTKERQITNVYLILWKGCASYRFKSNIENYQDLEQLLQARGK